jgi:phosphoglycolate phosphatase
MNLFFDFDGTLADSSPGIYASFQLACHSLGLNTPTYDVFCDSIGPPVQLLARNFFPDLSELQVEAFRQTFRHDYDTVRFRECQWYAGTKSTIEALASIAGTRLAIITNKPTKPTLELLEAGSLSKFFELVVGIDYQEIQCDGPLFPNKSAAIMCANRRLPASSSVGIYVGDTLSDKIASLTCGLKFVAATYGFYRWRDDELEGTDSIARIYDLIPMLLAPASDGQAEQLSADSLT